jgi:hypothetical protein
MSTDRPITKSIRKLLELLYLESASDEAKSEFAGMGDGEKSVTLKAFLQSRPEGSKKWAKRILDRL